MRALRVAWWIGKHAVRVAWLAAMVLVPLFAFWLASSIAAYQDASVWVALAIGLAMFPVLPLAWDLWYLRKRRKRGELRPPILTRVDRLVLRTLLVNGAFLALMIAHLPQVSFRALAVRGDWMLDGAHGRAADGVRSVLLGIADRFEQRWHIADDRYGHSDEAPADVEPPPKIDGWPVDPEPDLAVSAIPESAQGSIAAVGAYLLEKFPDPQRRVKAVHDYVILRLDYDFASLARLQKHDTSNWPAQDAETVFARKTAVCEGYARLMVALGKVTNLDIAYVTGVARLGDTEAGSDTQTDAEVRASLDGNAHAWNAVKLDGHWRLIDATWDDDKDPHAPIRSDYLFTPPELFVTNHLPEQASWQLLAHPIGAGEFVRRPLMEPRAAYLGVTLVEPARSQVTTSGPLAIELANPRHAALIVGFDDPDGKRHDCGELSTDETARFTCDVPDGASRVFIFGAASRGAKQYPGLGSISVNKR